jgi:hypothetical protein
MHVINRHVALLAVMTQEYDQERIELCAYFGIVVLLESFSSLSHPASHGMKK